MTRGVPARDLTGLRFHSLTALRVLRHASGGKVIWLCQCDCGKERQATTGELTRGGVKSCKECAAKGRKAKHNQFMAGGWLG